MPSTAERANAEALAKRREKLAAVKVLESMGLSGSPAITMRSRRGPAGPSPLSPSGRSRSRSRSAGATRRKKNTENLRNLAARHRASTASVRTANAEKRAQKKNSTLHRPRFHTGKTPANLIDMSMAEFKAFVKEAPPEERKDIRKIFLRVRVQTINFALMQQYRGTRDHEKYNEILKSMPPLLKSVYKGIEEKFDSIPE